MYDYQRVVFDVPGTHAITTAEILGTPLAGKTLVSVTIIPGYTTYTAAQIDNGELTLNGTSQYSELNMRVTYYQSGSSGTTQTTEITLYLVVLPDESGFIAGTDNAGIITNTVSEVRINLKFSSCDWTCKYNGNTLAANDTFSLNSVFSVNPSASERKYLTAVITLSTTGNFYRATQIDLSGMEIQIPLDATDPNITMSPASEYFVNENTVSDITIGYFTCNFAEQYSTPTITGSISGSLTGCELGNEGYDLSDILKVNVSNINNYSCRVTLAVKNGSLLDYERLYNAAHRNATYDATITVTIGSISKPATTKITIRDRNEGPIVMEDQTFNFPDRTSNATIQPTGTIVGQVIASDPDIYNRSFSQLTYRITTQTGNVFGIDIDYGVIYIVDGSGLAAGQSYEITVTATDGDFSKSATMTINITRGGRIITWNGKLIRPSNHAGSILRV